MTQTDSWSTQQLTVLLASISAETERLPAMHTALEFAVASVDAEVGAILERETSLTTIGFRPGREPLDQLVDVAKGRQSNVKTPDIAVERTFVVPMDNAGEGLSFVVGRCSEAPFTNEEKGLIRGMVRVLTLTLRSLNTLTRERELRSVSELQAAENARLLHELQERQDFLESLGVVQRMITSRAPLEALLDAIVERSTEHLAASVTMLMITEDDDPEICRIEEVTGVVGDQWRTWRGRTSDVAEDAICRNHPVIHNSRKAFRLPFDSRDDEEFDKMIAVPVQENGSVVGALIVYGSPERCDFDDNDIEMMMAFGEHVSIALTDVSTVNEVHRAQQDPLTGLPNRSLFLQYLEEALVSSPSQASVGVLFIDLDGFKRVNDTLGHSAGDRVLAAVADRLRNAVRSGDIVGRIGGDEFSLIAQSFNGSVDELSALAQRIVDSIKRPFRLYGRDIFIGASVGIAVNHSGDSDPEDLLRRSDVAMYRAKADRSGSLVFKEEMHEQLMKSLEIEGELRSSLQQRCLELHYQPVVNVSDRRLIGFEALVRWNHPRLGRLMPDAFVPLAEQSGWIGLIDNWVVGEACRQASEWKKLTGREVTIGVNVSGHGIVQDSFVDRVREALLENDLCASTLVLELTETVLIKDLDAVALRLEEIRLLGVRLAIDDFGTGYSSLTHLYRFPFNVIKIDRSFVSGVDTDQLSAGLVRAVVGLAAELGLETIAEGVESTSELEVLEAAGCSLAQGYLFHRPLEVPAATELLATLNAAIGPTGQLRSSERSGS